MDINEIKEEINDCKTAQGKINIKLKKRHKLMDFFNERKSIHTKILKRYLTAATMCSIFSFFFFISGDMFSAISFFMFGCVPVGVCINRLFVCKKFDKVIKKLEKNNIKYEDKLHELLQTELNLNLELSKLQSKTILKKEKTNKSSELTIDTPTTLSL